MYAANAMIRLPSILLAIGLAFSFPSSGQDVPEGTTLLTLSQDFDSAREKLNAPLQALQKKYEGLLNELILRQSKTGNRDAVLGVREELEAYQERAIEAASRETFPDLHRLQTIYRETAEKHRIKYSENLMPVAERYQAQLLAF